MPTWIANFDGSWTDSANWTGGVPSGLGAQADFTFGGVGTTGIVGIAETATIILSTLNVTLTNTGNMVLRGSATDSGVGQGVLNFTGSGGPANVNVTNSAATGIFEISSVNGLRVELGSATNFNVANAGGIARISASISGSGSLTKVGNGLLQLTATNTISGQLNVAGGILEANDAALGTAFVRLTDNAIFRSSGTIDNSFSTYGTFDTTADGRIVAATGNTLTLTGNLNHGTQGRMTFGSTSDAGTIIARFANVFQNATDSSYGILGGTLKIGDAYNGANLLERPGLGTTRITNAILDTNGFNTVISNLDLTNGTIRSSAGSLFVTVNDTTSFGNSQTGSIEGTGGIDRLEIFALNVFSLSGANFTNWTAGTDIILLSGSANNNSLTGSAQRDLIDGLGGNDTLWGNGGIDDIDGGDGNDTIILNALNAGSFVDGGTGADTLRLVDGGQYGLGSFTGFEGIDLQNNSALELTGAQFATGLSATATLSGLGVVRVNLSLGDQQMNASSMTVTGSTFTFSVNGSSGDDVVQVATNSASEIMGNGGNDLLVGSDLGDYIDGGSGINTLNGRGGDDLLVVAANGSGSFIDGGAGNDTLAVSGAVSLGGLAGIEAIQLASGAALTLTGSQFANGISLLGTTVSGAGSLTVNMDPDVLFVSANFAFSGGVAMTVNGTSGTDIIKCGPTSHTINAGGGVDQIRGGAAADTINGGDGNDKIMGFGGADVMTGGTGADQFRYILASDSGLGAAADRITDFAIGQDVLNFVLLDADAVTAGDQAFSFIGTAVFTNNGLGQIRYTNSGADLLVQVDSDGNGSADMAIILQGRAGSTLTAADFLL